MADLLFPPQCVLCMNLLDGEKPGSACSLCASQLRHLGDTICPLCGVPFPDSSPGAHLCARCLDTPPDFDVARATVEYRPPIQEAIIDFKYKKRTYLLECLSRLLMENPLLVGFDRSYDTILPVPMHPRKLRKRTYNQSVLLAARLSGKTGIPVDRMNLVKTRATPPQSFLAREDRMTNIRGAFSLRKPGRVEGKNILVVDDVMTTGTTLNECARVLKKAGAARVDAATVARTA